MSGHPHHQDKQYGAQPPMIAMGSPPDAVVKQMRVWTARQPDPSASNYECQQWGHDTRMQLPGLAFFICCTVPCMAYYLGWRHQVVCNRCKERMEPMGLLD